MLNLLGKHSADRYPLSTSTDDLMGTVESLGTKETTLPCRFVPLSADDRERYGIAREAYAYRVCFTADPDLDSTKALVWDDKVWRVREVLPSGGVGRVWVAIVEHVPQIELEAP